MITDPASAIAADAQLQSDYETPDRPWLSVIMPTYNGERHLSSALNSVARELDGGVELVAVDDGSTDSTLDVLASYSRAIPLRVVSGGGRSGWVAATNVGVRHARASWIGFLHQDDVWTRGRLQRIRTAIQASPSAGLIVGATNFIDEAGRVSGRWRLPWRGRCPGPIEVARRLYVQNWLAVPSVCVRADLLRRVGDLDETLWYTADWDLWLRLVREAPIASVPGPISGFRVHPASQTVRRSSDLTDFEAQLRTVQTRHRWAADANSSVLAAGEMSTRTNIALASALHGQSPQLPHLLRTALALSAEGWKRFLRDSRIVDRAVPRMRLALTSQTRHQGRSGSAPALQGIRGTSGPAYADRLDALQSSRWKRWLDVQKPYRWHLRSLQPGFTLDLGCGIGRNLLHLDGNGIGVDHNPKSVDLARRRGLRTFMPDEFLRTAYAMPGTFDTMLLSHVAEHMSPDDAKHLVVEYVAYMKPGAKLIIICPQERGYRSDPTHVTFMDFDAIRDLCAEAEARVLRQISFPFPRFLGGVFTYNEFVVVARFDNPRSRAVDSERV